MDALDAYADARPPVPPPASGVVADDPNQRQRFHVELAPGDTTIVSWKQLVQEANNEVVDDDSSDEEGDLGDYRQVEKSRIKESGYIVKRDKVQHKRSVEDSRVAFNVVRSRSDRKKSSISSNVRTKTMRKEIMDSVTSAALQKLQELQFAQHDLQSRSLMSKKYEQQVFTYIKQRNNKGRNNLPDLNLPCTEQAPLLS